MNERIEIRKTPELGSMKETANFVKKVTKESLSYRKNLARGSFRFLINTMKRSWKLRKVEGLVEECKKNGEGLLVSPDITVKGEKYWVLRYGPSFIKVPPQENFPTGYTVFTSKNNICDLETCKKICKLYRIWEKFYVCPLKVPRGKTMINWLKDFKMKLFDDISKRRQNGYIGLEGTEEEKVILQELDEQVYLFHDADMELIALEGRLGDLQFDLFDHPSETCINDFIQLVYRFQELMPLEKQYLDRRLDAWKRYRHLLERKYKVQVNLDFNMTDLGLAAFIDLMKYVLFQRTIPEAVLTKVSFEILKSVGKAKVSEYLLNLIVHYGGVTSLESQFINHMNLQKTLNGYIRIWESEIPPDMIRCIAP